MSRRGSVAAVVAVLVLCLGACGGGGADTATNKVVGQADEGIDGVMAIRVPANTHTDGVVAYGLHPPAGGKHNRVWLNCGFYDEPTADEHLVHDLEHGAVWLAYSTSLAAADVEVIHDLARANDKVVATPYPDLAKGVAVVATAWARQLTLGSTGDPRLEEFVTQYVDGSQAPEAGVTCSGSPLGTPVP